MISTLTGDLFASEAQTLVNTVNCVGVMGKGVALEFKTRFPEMFEDYRARCERGEVVLGTPYLYKRTVLPWVLNFPTKDHWRSVSRLRDIILGLEYLQEHYREWGIQSLAVPPLGCGHGGLEWRIVGPTLFRYLSQLEIPVQLYGPHGTPAPELSADFLSRVPDGASGDVSSRARTRVEPSWIALIEILARICREPYHWPIGRTGFQKIAYFGTQAGLPTGLEFRRGSFGPFSPDVKGMVIRLVNNGLLKEERTGRMFRVTPGDTYQDACSTYGNALTEWESAIERIADLFVRMTTSRAEIAATIDFAARNLEDEKGGQPSEADVFREVLQWKQKRRPPLNEQRVAEEIRNLNLSGWLALRPSPELPVETDCLLDV